jgi:hypothetical protein
MNVTDARAGVPRLVRTCRLRTPGLPHGHGIRSMDKRRDVRHILTDMREHHCHILAILR